ncbi:DUF4199 domain-containing protein [Cyclobacterium amurskyense]|uniref:DUF4199 domain-containing protein n=1 Tax=Cyclobacterium amurskyense TaxID=320787 RepID=A0A0H4PHS4_9BACT|nr:DUF4199 domain-containing protein [Cyclobacterium amurskyense]AKP52418.1 hypothetical protein CA2015_3014 [Cyclobacterium amurskyense]|tara:strand:- start:29714 stop:30229 length:516 start_codon:yes stop_codon:yes gene_type:complete
MNRYLKAALPFGLYGGGLCFLGYLTIYFLGIEPISMNLIIGYLVTPVFVFFGVKNFRDNFNGGNLYFGQGMTVGFFTYTIIATLSALYILGSIQIDQELFTTFRQINLELMSENKAILQEKLNVEAYEETYANISKMSIFDVALNDFLRKIFPGLFFTIIISIILKRNVEF